MSDSELVRAVDTLEGLQLYTVPDPLKGCQIHIANDLLIIARLAGKAIALIRAHESKQRAGEVDENQRWAFLSRLRPPPSQPTEQVQPDTKLNVSQPVNAQIGIAREAAKAATKDILNITKIREINLLRARIDEAKIASEAQKIIEHLWNRWYVQRPCDFNPEHMSALLDDAKTKIIDALRANFKSK